MRAAVGVVNLQILPLAITMMAGPQIMSAIIFVTHPQALRVSSAFVAAVAIATTAGVAIAYLLAGTISLGSNSDNGSSGHVIQIVLVGLLVLLALKNYLGRATAEPPAWLGTLMHADAKKAFRTGLLVIGLMPSDLIIMLTVGVNLQQNKSSLIDAVPFIAATTLVAALPLLLFLIFHKRAERAMPLVRDWMNAKSWLVNIIVCCIFIVLVLSG